MFYLRNYQEIDKKTLWLSISIFAGILSALKGIHLPNFWSATQIQIDYSFGLVKRGALGAFVKLLHIPVNHYLVFVVFSYVILLLAILFLILYMRRAFRWNGPLFYAPIFFSSLAITHFVDMVGYFDIVLFIITLVVLLCDSNRFLVVLAYAASCAGILIHEGFLFTFFPIILFRLFWYAATGYNSKSLWSYIHLVTLPLLVISIALFIALSRPISQEQFDLMRQSIAASIDFQLRPDCLMVLRRSLVDNLHIITELSP